MNSIQTEGNIVMLNGNTSTCCKNILKFQKINTNGSATALPLGGLFNIEVESPSNTHLSTK
jgi:hypothetical protein